MDVKIMALLAILDEEAVCYRTMKSVLADEEASISLSGKERFDQVQHEKESLVVKLQQLEEKRKQLVGQLSDATATNGRLMTVSELALFVKPPYNEKLLVRANRLRSIIGDVHKKNRRNQLLINQYLDLIKGSLKLLTHLIDDNSVYQKPGTGYPAIVYSSGGGRIFCGTV
ncbi:MAG: flagellar protein FlgN [Desulfosarcina sp.]|nr:flagellar protein FlgN [Desulfosarcina sp.]MBC2742064.1 flagellar protein FlgN [Desulfosarcina sp.]MBC2764977.1 flagellar protein FlgN [Desulfosarcina sp.]